MEVARPVFLRAERRDQTSLLGFQADCDTGEVDNVGTHRVDWTTTSAGMGDDMATESHELRRGLALDCDRLVERPGQEEGRW